MLLEVNGEILSTNIYCINQTFKLIILYNTGMDKMQN